MLSSNMEYVWRRRGVPGWMVLHDKDQLGRYIHAVLKKGIGQLLYCHSSRGTKHSSGAYEHA